MSRVLARTKRNRLWWLVAIASAMLPLFAGAAIVHADSLSHVGFFSPERVWTAAGNANLSLRQPDPRSGDLMIATIAVRPSTVTIATPSGWTLVDNRVGSSGAAEGADTGTVRKYIFTKVATGTEGTTNQTFTKTGTASVINGSIMQVRSATGTDDIAASGYSINGNVTTWNGSLPSDVGLQSGDLVVMSTATVGDASNASGQALSTPGVTAQSTVYEHGEFGSTTGNDIEQTLSTTLIRAGTSTGPSSLIHTKSVAASGVVSLVRVRQGAGVNRSDTWVRSAGSQVAGTTSAAARYPEHEVGDVLVLFVANKHDTSTPTTPAGWTLLGSYTGGAGSVAVDSGLTRITAYYRKVTALFDGAQTVSVPSGNSTVTQVVALHRDDNYDWVLASDGGADNTADTTWTATGAGLLLNSAYGGDILLAASSINTDLRTYSNYTMSASGITFGEVTETAEYRSANGNDMDLTIATGRIASGKATTTPTLTANASGSTTSAPAGAVQFVKVFAYPPNPGTLNVDIVDAGGSSVSAPALNFTGLAASADCQSSSGVFGTSSQRIRITNQTWAPGWSVSAAATAGSTAAWNSGLSQYDFNDVSGSGCSDGADADSLAGRLQVDPSAAAISPLSGCSSNGLSVGSATSFSEGSTNSITLASSSTASDTICSWDMTGIALTQTIPAYQAAGSYQLNVTITTVAN